MGCDPSKLLIQKPGLLWAGMRRPASVVLVFVVTDLLAADRAGAETARE
jgi:hypothetical protein